MNARRLIFLGAMTLAAVMPLSQARAGYGYSLGVEVRQVSDFYDPLAPFGYWVEVPRYGWCWYPGYVDQDWRPYCSGHWLWSDDGWYWASEEPWAWATYHYGRWVWDPYYAWLWVPGVEWAPAWVAWREGGDYVGWAPLPPEYDFGPGRDVIYAEQIVIAPQYFVFVQHRRFCDLVRPNVVIVNNTTIINKTVNITRINRVNQVVVNHGPSAESIEKFNPGKVKTARIERHRSQQTEDARSTPEIIRGSGRQADNSAVAQPTPVRPPETAAAQPQVGREERAKRRHAEDQTVIVHQMPPSPSHQKSPSAEVQNQPSVTSDAPPQSEKNNGHTRHSDHEQEKKDSLDQRGSGTFR